MVYKNPVLIALIASAVTFTVLFYYYNYYCVSTATTDNDTNDGVSKNKGKKKSKKKTKSKKVIINEVMVISTAVIGLIVWFFTKNYLFSSDVSDNANANNTNQNNANQTNANQNNMNLSINNQMQGGGDKLIPHLESDDALSFNLIGTGVNIPKGDLKVPPVLIDYQ